MRRSPFLSRLRPYPAAGLAAWTFFTWVGRLGLAWNDATLTTGAKVVATVPVVLFTGLGAAVAVVVLRRPDADLGAAGRKVVMAAGVWSIGYWAVRLPLILSHAHPVPFKVVHTVLALVSGGLSVWAWRAVNRAVDGREGPAATTGPAGDQTVLTRG